jgi:hypothetical protein
LVGVGLGALLLVSGCGGSQYPDINDPMPPPEKAAPPAPSAAASPRSADLQRKDVERVVDAGLGRFLSQVSVEPSLANGKFVGWSVVSLAPAEAWRDVDLRPGDVVTRINGMAIERETEAYDAFQAVRQAPSLEVSYLRRGQPRTLRFAIVGPPSLPPRQERPAPSGSAAEPGPAAPNPG